MATRRNTFDASLAILWQRQRITPETAVPTTPAMFDNVACGFTTVEKIARAAMLSPTPTAMIKVERPRAKKNLEVRGRCPSDMSFCVTLSIAQIWCVARAQGVNGDRDLEPHSQAVVVKVTRGVRN